SRRPTPPPRPARTDGARTTDGGESDPRVFLARLPALASEKTPFFVLAALVCVLTVRAQAAVGAVTSAERLPLDARLANAVVSCARYLIKMAWPSRLAAFYPRPASWPAWEVLLAAAVVAGVTAGALLAARTRPYLTFGWFWYLGTLVPVIGLVQVGLQAMADRYTYIPSIGIFVAVAWGLSDLATRAGIPARAAGASRRAGGGRPHPSGGRRARRSPGAGPGSGGTPTPSSRPPSRSPSTTLSPPRCSATRRPRKVPPTGPSPGSPGPSPSPPRPR